MSHIACGADGACPYQYTCTNNICVHDGVFPIMGYPIAIYCLYPIASAICNTSGNSFGQFKVLLLMDALDYSQSEATTLCYPLILGTALYNIVRLILKRHPYKETSIVDYNIVMIIIPCVLYGSTIGSLVNNFIPPIVADCLIIVLLTAFSTKFFLKLRGLIRQSKAQKQSQVQVLATEPAKSMQEKEAKRESSLPQALQLGAVQKQQDKDGNIEEDKKRSKSKLTVNGVIEQMIDLGVVANDVNVNEIAHEVQLRIDQAYRQSVENTIDNKIINTHNYPLLDTYGKQRQLSASNSFKTGHSKMVSPYQDELEKQLQYQRTYHMPHVLGIIVLFVVFESAAFLAQGKIIHFGFCSKYYSLGMGLLSVFFIIVMFFIYLITNKKLKYYQTIGYQYEYPLNKFKYFGMICIGSFLGGFNGGVFAIGNSTTIIFTLLYLEVEPIVTSATVGFQVVFAAAASLCEALARGSIAWNTVIFFFVLTLVAGGILSFIAGHFVGKLDRQKVNMILVGIVACLTCASGLSMVINIVLGYTNFGASYMIQTPPLC